MKKTLLLPIFFFLFMLPLSVNAQEYYTFNFRLPSYELYAPAKIIVSFVYTNNVSTNVRTLGTSLYKITTSPVQIVFEAEAFDVYTIDVLIEYAIPVNQTVIIGLYEGGRAVKGIEFDTSSSRICLSMHVSVVEAPTFPTAEQIADAMANWLQSYLSEYTAQQTNTINKMSETMLAVGVLAVIGFVVSIAVLLAVFYVHRRVAELSEWGIRHESEHRKEGG
ncbi:MAG: hypothetical protein QXZ02_08130 [Candidatus Bathyarchaeia archaeon]